MSKWFESAKNNWFFAKRKRKSNVTSTFFCEIIVRKLWVINNMKVSFTCLRWRSLWKLVSYIMFANIQTLYYLYQCWEMWINLVCSWSLRRTHYTTIIRNAVIILQSFIRFIMTTKCNVSQVNRVKFNSIYFKWLKKKNKKKHTTRGKLENNAW